MKKSIILLLLLILIFILLVLIVSTKKEISQVCFSEKCFNVELAQTEEEQAKGLMFREHLAQDRGMLFIFKNSGRHSFWMKNTLIPLDVIWINSDLKIVDIKTLEPCAESLCESYTPAENSLYVLEINKDLAQLNNFSLGD